MRLGVHCSIKNGLSGVIREAIELKCETIQFFTRSPRNWKKSKFEKNEILEFKKKIIENNITPLILHTPYLPNLATSKKMLYKKSIRILIQDLIIADKLGADYLTIHPGAYSLNSSPEEGLNLIANAINYAFEKVKSDVVLLIENVSGGGRKLCKKYEEIKEVIKNIKDKKRIGVCFDTAHAHAAGYNLSSFDAVNETLKMFDEIIGLEFLKVVHLNDSFFKLNEQKDRHQHIGEGFIGLEGFKAILNHPKLKNIAGIIETPKDTEDADKKNMDLLFALRNSPSS